MCGCSGKKSNNRRVYSNNRLVRTGPNNSSTPNGSTPEQLRILNIQNTENKPNNLDSDKRRIEKLRRDAVRKALNK